MIKHQLNRVLNLLLEKEALLVLKKYKPKVVVIIGDGDRASTRHAIDIALSKFYFTRSGQGTALTVLGFEGKQESFWDWCLILIEGVALILLPNHYPEWLILESKFGEADYYVQVGDTEGLEFSDYEVIYDDQNLPKGMTFKVLSVGVEYPVYLRNTVGYTQIHPVLSALKFAKTLGEHFSVISKAFEQHDMLEAHLRLIGGIKGSVIIDDSHNSSPDIMSAGLITLASLSKSKRRIAILGDILGLDKDSIEEHKKIGNQIGKKIDLLVVVGIRSRYIAEEALNNGMSESNIFQFDEAEEAGDFVQNLIEAGDVIYVNGSKGMNMSTIVEELAQSPK